MELLYKGLIFQNRLYEFRKSFVKIWFYVFKMYEKEKVCAMIIVIG